MKYIVDETLIEEAQSSMNMAEDECSTIESALSEIQSYICDASTQLDDMKTKLVNEQENSLEQFLTVLDSELEDLKYRVKTRLESELGLE